MSPAGAAWPRCLLLFLSLGRQQFVSRSRPPCPLSPLSRRAVLLPSLQPLYQPSFSFTGALSPASKSPPAPMAFQKDVWISMTTEAQGPLTHWCGLQVAAAALADWQIPPGDGCGWVCPCSQPPCGGGVRTGVSSAGTPCPPARQGTWLKAKVHLLSGAVQAWGRTPPPRNPALLLLSHSAAKWIGELRLDSPKFTSNVSCPHLPFIPGLGAAFLTFAHSPAPSCFLGMEHSRSHVGGWGREPELLLGVGMAGVRRTLGSAGVPPSPSGSDMRWGRGLVTCVPASPPGAAPV